MVRTPEQREARRIWKERRARGEYKWSAEAREKKSEAMSGKHPSDATIAKISKSLSGENRPRGMLGKTHSDATIAKMSEAHSGENSSMGGKPTQM